MGGRTPRSAELKSNDFRRWRLRLSRRSRLHRHCESFVSSRFQTIMLTTVFFRTTPTTSDAQEANVVSSATSGTSPVTEVAIQQNHSNCGKQTTWTTCGQQTPASGQQHRTDANNALIPLGKGSLSYLPLTHDFTPHDPLTTQLHPLQTGEIGYAI